MSEEFHFEADEFPAELLGEDSQLEEERRAARGGARYAPRRRAPRPRARQWPRVRPRWPVIAWPSSLWPAAPGGGDWAGQAAPADDAEPAGEPASFDDGPPDAAPAAEPNVEPDAETSGGLTYVPGTNSHVIDLTARADASVRRTRDPKSVYAVVLHQMACCFAPRDPLTRFLSLRAHYAILPDGRILQIHPVAANIPASNHFNAYSVAIEFAGNFPNTHGRWWEGAKYGRNQPTDQQLRAGRYLLSHLQRTLGVTHVFAHRQASPSRDNDPGPEVWFHVGQWAIDNLRMTDGGAHFKVGAGNPIPDAWRTWGRRSLARELDPLREAEQSETEIAHDLEHSESDAGEQEVAAAVRQAVAALPAGGQPAYRNVGRLADAANRVSGPGLYLIVFNSGGRERAYSGKALDLRRRLLQHRLCAQMLGVSIANHRVLIAPLPAQSLRSTEQAINAHLRAKHAHLFTNQRAELEAELMGEAWL